MRGFLSWISNPQVITKTPLVTVALLELANAGQLHRMWTEQTAEGQSLVGWLLVFFALIGWWNFYRVCTPKETWARRATAVGIGINAMVWLSVIYWRYLA